MSQLESNPATFVRDGLGTDFSELCEIKGWRFGQPYPDGLPDEAVRLCKEIGAGRILSFARWADSSGADRFYIERAKKSETPGATRATSFLRRDLRPDRFLRGLFDNALHAAELHRDSN